MSRRLLLIPLSLVMLVGFGVQPMPVAHTERVNVIDLATRVALVEEENAVQLQGSRPLYQRAAWVAKP